MAPSYPPLPYRPLEERAHGVYDPARGTFYPCRCVTVSQNAANPVVAAKPGIMYYVRQIAISGASTVQATSTYVRVYFNAATGGTVYPVSLYAESSPTGNTPRAVSVVVPVRLLTGAGDAISVLQGGWDEYRLVIIYAEIPADNGEVPV